MGSRAHQGLTEWTRIAVRNMTPAARMSSQEPRR